MKKILFAVFILMSYVSFAQTTGYFRYDSVRIQRGGGNATLIIENATRNVTNGFLQNYGEGRTRFARALDSVWVDGDSLRFRYGLTTIAVLAPGGGGGPSFGFFNDETNSGGATTKDANSQNYTLTNADTLTLGFNQLVFSNLASGGVDENSEFVIRSGIDGTVYTAPVSSLLFGAGDNVFNDDRYVDLNGNSLRLGGEADGWASDYLFEPAFFRFEHQQEGGRFATMSMDPYQLFIRMNDNDVSSGITMQGVDINYVNLALQATGYMIFATDSLQYDGIGTVSDTTEWKPFVVNSAGWVKKFDRWPGGGVTDNIYTANGTLTSNRTVTGDNKSLRFNGVSTFGVRANGVSLDQLYVDGSTAALYSPAGDALLGVSNGLIEMVAADISMPIFAGVGDRYAGFDVDGKLKVMPTPGGGSGDGIDEVIAGYGLVNVNDSTLSVDTTGAFEDWVESKVTANLIVQHKGTFGKRIWSTSGDTLYMHTLDEGYGINITKLADSTNVIGADTTQLATRDYVIDQISQIPPSTGSGITLTDDPLSLSDDFAMGIDTIRHRSFIKEYNVVRWGPITDSAFTLTQLSTPGSFTATTIDDDEIGLSWTDVSNEIGYEIYRHTSNVFGSATLITTTAANATSYTSGSLSSSTTYYYWILAKGDGSIYSNSNTATDDATTDAGLDSDASAYLARVAAHGVTITTPQQTAVNQFFVDLKANSLYTLYYDIWFFGWNNAAANAEPLKAVAPDVTWVNSPTHSSSGVAFNGSTQYGNLGVAPNVLSLNNSSLGIRTSSTANASVADMGARGATSTVRFDILAMSASFLTGEMNSNTAGTGQVTGSVANAAGMSTISRTSSTDLRAYRNGTQVGSTSTTTNNGTMPTINMYIGAVNNNGAAGLHAARTYQGAWLASGLSSGQVATQYTIFNALYTAFGF